MESSKVFGTVLFVRGDYSSGVDKHEIDYDSALNAIDYADYFLEKTRQSKNAIIVKIFSLEVSVHDTDGHYQFDKFHQIVRKAFTNEDNNVIQLRP